MKVIFIFSLMFSSMLSANIAYGASEFNCVSGDYEVNFNVAGDNVTSFTTNGEIPNGTNPSPYDMTATGGVVYSFYFYDYADTNYWINVTLKNETILSAEEWSSGNDSDNYQWSKTSTKVVCKKIK